MSQKEENIIITFDEKIKEIIPILDEYEQIK